MVQAALAKFGKTDAIGKAFAVLRCFIDGQEEWGVRELATTLGQPTSSVHRLLKILRREGFLEFDETVQRYRVGLEFVRVSAAVARRTRLGPVAAPVMAELQERTNESVWLALYEPQRDRIVYLMEQPTSHVLRVPAPIGREVPLGEDIAGEVVLASLSEERLRGKQKRPSPTELAGVRERGFAIRFTSDRDPVALLAAPILNSTNDPAGALVIAIPGHRFRETSELGLAATLVRAAREISERLGAQILGGASSGSWHDGLEVIAGVISRRVSSVSTVPSLGGGNQNLVELREGRGAYCMTTLASATAAYLGQPPFNHRPFSKLRIVASMAKLNLQMFARKGIRVERFRDVRSLRVSAGLSGFSTHQLFHDLLRLAGVRDGEMAASGGTVVQFDYPEAARQLAAGTLDVVFGLLVSETFKPVVADGHAHLVPLDPQLIRKLIAANPAYIRDVIPADTFAGQKQDVATVMVPTLLVTSADRSAQEVFEVARVIDESRDDLFRASSAYAAFSRAYTSIEAPVPFHPGAKQYLDKVRPIGSVTPERPRKIKGSGGR